MRQFRIRRTVATIPWQESAGGIKVDLPRQYDLESIGIRISGTLTFADAATAILAESPTQLISRVELVSDGKNTIQSVPFWSLVFGNFERPNSVRALSRNAVPPSDVAAAAYAVSATGYLDQATLDSIRPKDSNFRTAGLNLWELKFTFGRAVDTAAGVAAATFVGTVEIWVEETVELPGADGKFSVPGFLKKRSFQQFDAVNSNSQQEVRLPAGNLIRSVLIRAATNGDPSTAILNNLRLESGVDVRVNLSDQAVLDSMEAEYGVLAQSGYYLLDFIKQGNGPAKLSNLWDVTRQAEPKLFLDVTGAAGSVIQVITTEYIQLAG